MRVKNIMILIIIILNTILIIIISFIILHYLYYINDINYLYLYQSAYTSVVPVLPQYNLWYPQLSISQRSVKLSDVCVASSDLSTWNNAIYNKKIIIKYIIKYFWISWWINVLICVKCIWNMHVFRLQSYTGTKKISL